MKVILEAYLMVMLSCILMWNRTSYAYKIASKAISTQLDNSYDLMLDNQTSLARPRFFNHDELPEISYQMSEYHEKFAPESFAIRVVRLSKVRIVVEFNYSKFDIYNRYSLHIRYHSHVAETVVTNKTFLDKIRPNRIELHNFPHATYIACITLYAVLESESVYLLPPVSTSDMCADIYFGEKDEPSIGEHYGKTGMLMAALLVLVGTELFIIAIIYEVRKAKLIKKLCHLTSKSKRQKSKLAHKTKTYAKDLKDLEHVLDKEKNEELKFTNILLYYGDEDAQNSDEDDDDSGDENVEANDVEKGRAAPIFVLPSETTKARPTGPVCTTTSMDTATNTSNISSANADTASLSESDQVISRKSVSSNNKSVSGGHVNMSFEPTSNSSHVFF